MVEVEVEVNVEPPNNEVPQMVTLEVPILDKNDSDISEEDSDGG